MKMLFFFLHIFGFLSRVFEQGFIYVAFDTKFYEDIMIKMEPFLQLERSHTHTVYMCEHR